MKNNRTSLILSLVFLAIPVSLWSQDTTKSHDGFILTTEPSGATVYLNGEYTLVINTPARLPSNLQGRYRTRIIRPGYEQWKGELNFVPGDPNSVKINLKRKTPLKSGMRSLLIPGWGQFYSGANVRGSIYSLAVIGSAVGLYFADQRYQDRRADYDIASQQYVNAPSIDERNRLLTIRNEKQRLAYKAENDRRNVFYLGAGIWALNVIDAMLFFPGGEAKFPAVTAMDGGAMIHFVTTF